MSDERDPIDASLQRLFGPPDLRALQAKIDAAAAERIEPARAQPNAARGRGRTIGIAAIAVAAAAAAVFLLAPRSDPGALPSSRDADRDVPTPIAARRHAGAQLVRFYAAGGGLPRPDDGSCVGPAPPPASCIGDPREPQLTADDDLELIGECGDGGCAAYDLPAARLVHLRLQSAGTEVLVCVEPKDRDPQPLLPDDAGLQIFRRDLGAFILYEITPLAEPHALDHFRL